MLGVSRVTPVAVLRVGAAEVGPGSHPHISLGSSPSPLSEQGLPSDCNRVRSSRGRRSGLKADSAVSSCLLLNGFHSVKYIDVKLTVLPS